MQHDTAHANAPRVGERQNRVRYLARVLLIVCAVCESNAYDDAMPSAACVLPGDAEATYAERRFHAHGALLPLAPCAFLWLDAALLPEATGQRRPELTCGSIYADRATQRVPHVIGIRE